MITLTLITAVAFVVGLIGLLFVYNGFRWAILEDTGIGAVLLLVAWYLFTL